MRRAASGAHLRAWGAAGAGFRQAVGEKLDSAVGSGPRRTTAGGGKDVGRLAYRKQQWRLGDDNQWLGSGSRCNSLNCISRNVAFVEITTCCATGSKPRNVIIVGIQLYGVSLKPVQLGWMVPMLGRWWSFTTRTRIFGNWEN